MNIFFHAPVIFPRLQESHTLFRIPVLNQVVTVLHWEPHQSPIRIKAVGKGSRTALSSPLATVWPQKTVGAKPCPQVQCTDCVVSPKGHPLLGSWLRRSGCLRTQPEDVFG